MGRLTLDRADAGNALCLPMIETLSQALEGWRDDPAIGVVVIDHAEGRAFCAGGDAMGLLESARTDGAWARRYFAEQYQLNALIFHYPKPVVTVLDGAALGGGLGLLLPAAFRVSTEVASLAFGETGVGMVPDVGASWFLSRLPRGAGMWLALTGTRLKAADGHWLGLLTHHVPAAGLDSLRAELAARPEQVADILASAHRDPGEAPAAAHAEAIERCFAAVGLDGILTALGADPDRDWARAQLDAVAAKSPLAVAASVRLLGEAAAMQDFDQALALEHRLSSRLVQGHDFMAAIQAFVVERSASVDWRPARLDQVSPAAVEALFAPSSDPAWAPRRY